MDWSESAARRAIRDTLSKQKTARFMWGGEGVLAVAGGAWLTSSAVANAPTWEMVLRAVVGGLGGLFVAVLCVFIYNIVLTPYKQRNEARERLNKLEDERIPKVAVKPCSGRRQWEWEYEHLM